MSKKFRLLAALAVRVVVTGAQVNVARETAVIRNGVPRKDVNGQIMDAHDGQVTQWEAGGLYYMYAMQYGASHPYNDDNSADQENPGGPANASLCDNPTTSGWPVANVTNDGARTDHNITIWTSPNLADGSWSLVRREGIEVATRPKGLYYRPKVIYNRAAREYVLWGFRCNSTDQTNPDVQSCVYYVARSYTPAGPFVVVVANASKDAANADDFDLWVDPDSDEAYIVFEQNLASLQVTKLTADYRAFNSTVTPSLLVDGPYEAPAVFRRKGVFYFLYGWIVCFGRRGAGATVATSKHIMGPYTLAPLYDVGCQGDSYSLKEPCVGTLRAQQAYIVTVPCANGDDELLWVGDQWLSAPDHLFGHQYQAWQQLRFNNSTDPPTLQKQKATVDPDKGIASDIVVGDICNK